MINYAIVDMYIEHEENKEQFLKHMIEFTIKDCITNMFTQENPLDETLLEYVLERASVMSYEDGSIYLYFEDVRKLDWLKSKCSSFEYNIKIVLKNLSDTIRFIYDTEVE